MPAAQFMRLMAVNYGGTVNITKAVLPGMLQQRSGEIIVFGSIAGMVPTQEMGAYCATKAAVAAYMEVLTHEHEHAGIKFLLVCPPVVDTPLLAQMQNGGPGSVGQPHPAGQNHATGRRAGRDRKGTLAGRKIVYPGEAQAAQIMRRWAPNLMWKLTTKANQRPI